MIHSIRAGELMKKLNNGEKLRLVDVREEGEYQSAHLDNSENLPVTSLKEKYLEALPDKGEEIVLICRSGGRSMVIAIFLESEGYTNLTNFEGGVLDWTESGLKLTPTQEILASQLRAMPDFF